MKRKQYRYYWETSLIGCRNIFSAVVAEVNGYGATRFYSANRKFGKPSQLSNVFWSEWAAAPHNKGILFRITRIQFLEFQKTGKYPKDLGLKE